MPAAFRPVEPGDIPAMAGMRAREWQTEAFWRNRIERYLSGDHSPQQALPERAAFIATEGAAVLGFVSGHRTRRHECDGELQWLNVIRERRGQGIAGQLLSEMAAWFVRRDAFRICVNVDADNAPARALYGRSGAEPLYAQWMVWADIRTVYRKIGSGSGIAAPSFRGDEAP